MNDGELFGTRGEEVAPMKSRSAAPTAVRIAILMPVMASVLGCGALQESIKAPGQPTAHTVSASGQTGTAVGAQPPTCSAPLSRVAVYRFEDRTAKGRGYATDVRWYSTQIGDGMADMLTDALLQSGCFRVVDRRALRDVLQEQDLGTHGRVVPESRAPVGKILGAEYLVKGLVTEFEPGAAGARAGAVLGGGSPGGAVVGGAVGALRSSHVAMVLQILDATTSELVGSTTVEGTANDFTIGGFLAGFGGGVAGAGGLGVWQKTPVEKAIRISIVHGTREIASRVAAKVPQAATLSPAPSRRATRGAAVSQPPTPAGKIQPAAGVATPLASSAPGVATTPVSAVPPGGEMLLPSAVVVKLDAVNVRDTAGMQGKVIGMVRRGAELAVAAKEGEWFAIQWRGGIAYVHQSTVATK